MKWSIRTTMFLAAVGMWHWGFAVEIQAAEKGRPNVVFFLVDDLGFMDIGVNNPGTFYETPNVDRLAASGVRFTNGYAANPVCSPTRYSIMTGKYPSRVAATNFFAGKRSGKFLPAELLDRMPLSEVTVAEAFREGGYRTGFFGKWHLGPTEEFWPDKQGFEVNKGGHNRGMPKSYFSPYANPRLEDGEKGEFLTMRLASEVEGFIEETPEGEPFFAYLAFYTVHTPLRAPKELVEKYKKKAAEMPHADRAEFGDEEQVFGKGARKVREVQNHAVYAAMVESMDTAVGKVLYALEQNGVADNTVVCFFSDNGGLSTSEGSPTSNLPYRGGKGWVYEGGIKEPMIIRAPGVGKAGRVCEEAVVSTDFYPTLLDLCGLDLRPEQHLDGVSLMPLLRGEDAPKREAIYWHYPHYSNQGGFPGGAVRMGDFKLVERFEDGRVHLYNLAEDPGERKDLAEGMPERVGAMRKKLHTWYGDVGAKFLRKGESGDVPWKPGDA